MHPAKQYDGNGAERDPLPSREDESWAEAVLTRLDYSRADCFRDVIDFVPMEGSMSMITNDIYRVIRLGQIYCARNKPTYCQNQTGFSGNGDYANKNQRKEKP